MVRRANAPALLELILPNPPETGARLLSRRVTQLEYHHADVKPRDVHYHPFGPGVEMWALPGGEILLRHADGLPLHADFAE